MVEDVAGADRVSAVRLKNIETGATTEFHTDGLFVAIGYSPATKFLNGQLALTENGYAIVHDRTHASVEGVFVAGDVEDFRYRQAVTAAAGGCMAAMDAEKWLAAQGT